MQEITRRLSEWYKINKRNLPWRQTSDPYQIWLSEVILQQTRIQQGMDYYIRFSNKYPTVFDLAKAPIDEVLKLWQGLGYYTRARNLHETAKVIANNYNGIFPSTYSEIIKLKGIGDYTAAAIASIAFNESVAVIDGNVLRVVSRLFSIEEPVNSNQGKKEVKRIVDELIDENDPGTFNQAIMEYGSLYCTPQKPDCENCTLKSNCIGYKNNKVDILPIKIKSKPQQTRYFYYIVISDNNRIIINKRTKNDIWKGLYEFPLKEAEKKLTKNEIIQIEDIEQFSNGEEIAIKTISKEYKHILSHRIIKAKFIVAEADKLSIQKNDTYIIIPKKDISNYAVPRLIDRFLKDYNYI
jgi:A/G-specific adenine glycosylase